MINFSDEIAELTPAQTGFALQFLVTCIEIHGQATASDVRQAIENARAQS